MKKMKEATRNTLIILSCLFTLAVLFTIDGYVEYKEEQRNKKFLCNQQEVDGDLGTYFLKGINPSY